MIRTICHLMWWSASHWLPSKQVWTNTGKWDITEPTIRKRKRKCYHFACQKHYHLWPVSLTWPYFEEHNRRWQILLPLLKYWPYLWVGDYMYRGITDTIHSVENLNTDIEIYLVICPFLKSIVVNKKLLNFLNFYFNWGIIVRSSVNQNRFFLQQVN